MNEKGREVLTAQARKKKLCVREEGRGTGVYVWEKDLAQEEGRVGTVKTLDKQLKSRKGTKSMVENLTAAEILQFIG